MKNVERLTGELRRWLIAILAMVSARLTSHFGGAVANLISTVLYGVAAVMIGKTLYARQTFQRPALLKQHLEDERQKESERKDTSAEGKTLARDQSERTVHAKGIQVASAA